jgi:polyhydroxybutyrate depolymerase
VSVLEIHGTADTVIPYAGGFIGINAFPSAATSVSDWATFDGCATPGDSSGAPLDLDATLFGSETTVLGYKGCKSSSAVALWSIQFGLHVPTFNPSFIPAVLDFLYAHPKP